MDTKTRPLYKLSTGDPPQNRLKVKGWKKIFHANGDQKKAGVAILISDKIDFERKGHGKRQRRTLHNDQRINPGRKYNNFKYIYAPNMGALQYVRQMLTSMKREINSYTIIVGDFNTPFTIMDRSTKQLTRKHKL